MNSNNDRKRRKSDSIDKIIPLLKICSLVPKICYRGLFRVGYSSLFTYFFVLIWLTICISLVTWGNLHFRFFNFLFRDAFMWELTNWFESLGVWVNIVMLYFGLIFWILFILGLMETALIDKFNKFIFTVGIKNSNGENPCVVKVTKVDELRTMLKVLSPGMGPNDWTSTLTT